MKKINVGCGMDPTLGLGWGNFDNSFSIKLSKSPLLSTLLYKLKLINPPQMDYIEFCQRNNILWADATKKIPLADNSLQVLYSSHMLEHLDREEAMLFLKEAKRVLATSGIIRLALPDIEKQIKVYIENKDADVFIESTHMCVSRPRTISQRIKTLLIGTRHHQWMYDGKSLSKLLTSAGFSNPVVLKAGETGIKDSAELDLHERSEESVYVEATKT